LAAPSAEDLTRDIRSTPDLLVSTGTALSSRGSIAERPAMTILVCFPVTSCAIRSTSSGHGEVLCRVVRSARSGVPLGLSGDHRCLNGAVAPLCLLVLCGAPLTSRAPSTAKALQDAGLRVKVAATAAAAQWVDEAVLQEVVGHRCFTSYPDEARAEDAGVAGLPDAVVVVPMTFNTVNKLATGIADGYIPTQLCMALGRGVPVVAVPMFSQILARHPVLATNTGLLRSVGVEFVDPVTGDSEVRAFAPGHDRAVVEGFDPAWVVARVQQSLA